MTSGLNETASPTSLAPSVPAVHGHLNALDGLRGLAIALVLVHNVGAEQGNFSTLWLKALFFVLAPGWAGVQLFFVLSGFLITGILLDGPCDLRSFYVRRALRIFPLYYTVLFILLVLRPRLVALPPEVIDRLHFQGWYWSYLSNWVAPWKKEIDGFTHFWSLAVEEQFYLVWPLATLLLRRRAFLRFCIGIVAIAFTVRILVHALSAPPLVAYEWTIARMDALALGAIAALVVRDARLWAIVRAGLRRGFAASMAALLLLWPLSRGLNRDHVLTQTVGYLVLGVGCAQLVLLCVAGVGSERLTAALSAGPLRFLGRYSYAIYVLHVPITRAIASRFDLGNPSAWRSFRALVALEIAVAGLSIIGALLSWNLLEKHFLSLKETLAPVRRDKALQ